MKWTPEMDDTLKALDLKNFSILEQCAAMFEKFETPFTKNQITSARTRLKLTKRRNTRHRPLQMLCDSLSDPSVPSALEAPREALKCQYPIGNPGEPDFHFCGEERGKDDNGRPHPNYCNEHHEECHERRWKTPRSGNEWTGLMRTAITKPNTR